MLTDAQLFEQLPHVLTHSDFSFLGERYEGKVRDNYTRGDTRYLITTDRLSCFDVVVTSIPFKGQVLNELAVHWFKLSAEIIPNHFIEVPDPNVMVVKNCEILPVEVVVRAYLAGSAGRDYQAGKDISGVKLPPGLKISSKLPEIIITPSTKAAKGSHDLPISEAEILRQNLVAPKLWAEVREAALSLFRLGQSEADARGLILVDTKYEFGLFKGKLVLADEVHTVDCSRYWIKDTYAERFSKGEAPEMLDKEPIRQWLLGQGYKGEGPIPRITDEFRVQIAHHYINSFERISGLSFAGKVGPVQKRIAAALK